MERLSPERGSVWWAELEGLGRKPVVVVSRNRSNRILAEVIVARITSVERDRFLPTAIVVPPGHVDALGERSFVICHDLRTITKPRLVEAVGRLRDSLMAEVEDGLRFALALG